MSIHQIAQALQVRFQILGSLKQALPQIQSILLTEEELNELNLPKNKFLRVAGEFRFRLMAK